MKRLSLIAVAVAASCAPLSVGTRRELPARLAIDPMGIEVENAPESFKRPRLRSFGNGLEVVLVEDHATPLVHVHAYFGCGRLEELQSTRGETLALLTAMLMGGAGPLSAEQQRGAYRKLGRSPGYQIRDDTSGLTFTARARDLAALVSLVTQTITTPALGNEAVAALRARAAERRSAETRLESTRSAVQGRLMFGGQSPLATEIKVGTSIERSALKAKYARCVTPRNVTLAIAGDFSERAVLELLEPLAAWLPPATPNSKTPTKRVLPPQRHVVLLETPEALPNRVEVRLLNVGLPLGPEREAAEVLSSLLVSYLHEELRNRFGLVYSVHGAIEQSSLGGVSWLSFTVKPEHALAATYEALAALERLWNRWPWSGQNSETLGWTAAHFASLDAATIAGTSALARRLGLGESEALDTEARVTKLTMNDVREVFAATMRPALTQVIVSGSLQPADGWATIGEVEALTLPAE